MSRMDPHRRYQTDASRWHAIQTRDQAATSWFVYAVVSTKIYCRPACPSRIARRANVCFYDTTREAEAAGFRPCLRCKPNQPLFESDSQHAQRDAVRRACDYIHRTQGQAKFPDVAKHVGLSTRYLYALFKAVMGTTPARYAANVKSGGMSHTPSTEPFTGSSASSPFLEGFHQSSTSPTQWSASADPDYLEFSALNRVLKPVSPFNDFCDGSLLAASVSDDFPAGDEASYCIPFEPYYELPPSLTLFDPLVTPLWQ